MSFCCFQWIVHKFELWDFKRGGHIIQHLFHLMETGTTAFQSVYCIVLYCYYWICIQNTAPTLFESFSRDNCVLHSVLMRCTVWYYPQVKLKRWYFKGSCTKRKTCQLDTAWDQEVNSAAWTVAEYGWDHRKMSAEQQGRNPAVWLQWKWEMSKLSNYFVITISIQYVRIHVVDQKERLCSVTLPCQTQHRRVVIVVSLLYQQAAVWARFKPLPSVHAVKVLLVPHSMTPRKPPFS